MEKNREQQLLKHIERLNKRIADLYEKCTDLTYALEREKALTKSYKEQCKK